MEYKPYDFITKLPASHESEPGWWKLKWRPIKNGTWNMCLFKGNTHIKRFMVYRMDWNNGWHRSWNGINLHIRLPGYDFMFWFRWDFLVHENGPSDWKEKMKFNKEKMRFEWE